MIWSRLPVGTDDPDDPVKTPSQIRASLWQPNERRIHARANRGFRQADLPGCYLLTVQERNKPGDELSCFKIAAICKIRRSTCSPCYPKDKQGLVSAAPVQLIERLVAQAQRGGGISLILRLDLRIPQAHRRRGVRGASLQGHRRRRAEE